MGFRCICNHPRGQLCHCDRDSSYRDATDIDYSNTYFRIGVCKIIELSPAAGTEFKPKADFDMKVVLKNIGSTDWNPSSIDIKFISAVDGVKIHQGEGLYDLPSLVEPDDQITIYIDMLSPADPGSYGETWALVSGSTVICKWSISIKVK